MTEKKKVAYPPHAEATRQVMVHSLRENRAGWIDRLVRSNFYNTEAINALMSLNAKIEILKAMREPRPDSRLEPTVDQVRERGLSWYWEPWEETYEDDDDTEKE